MQAENVWVLTNESTSAGCEGLSLIGCYSTPLKALKALAEEEIGRDEAASLTWTWWHAQYAEGHHPSHLHCYSLTRSTVDEPL